MKMEGENSMKKCPECGSTEIINDLTVFAGEAPSGQKVIYISLKQSASENASFVSSPKEVNSGFNADVCGNCGYSQFYATKKEELLEAYKKGFKSLAKSRVVII
jgi:predicted nucleic-acid-binding Zn-ribbon protein